MTGNSFHNCERKFFMMLQIGHRICLCKKSYLHISGGVVMVHRVPVHHQFWTFVNNNFHFKLMETLCKILEFFQWCTIDFKTLRRPSLWNILGFTKQIMQKNGNLQNATLSKQAKDMHYDHNSMPFLSFLKDFFKKKKIFAIF